MKKTRIISLVMAMIIMFSTSPAFAVGENTSLSVESDESLAFSYVWPNNGSHGQRAGEYTSGTVSIIRLSPTDTKCEVNILIAGNVMISSLRFKSMVIKSTSSLFPEIYKEFLPNRGATYCNTTSLGAVAGSVYVGTVSIPTNVKTVKVSFDDLQLYRMSDATWYSFNIVGGSVTLN